MEESGSCTTSINGGTYCRLQLTTTLTCLQAVQPALLFMRVLSASSLLPAQPLKA